MDDYREPTASHFLPSIDLQVSAAIEGRGSLKLPLFSASAFLCFVVIACGVLIKAVAKRLVSILDVAAAVDADIVVADVDILVADVDIVVVAAVVVFLVADVDIVAGAAHVVIASPVVDVDVGAGADVDIVVAAVEVDIVVAHVVDVVAAAVIVCFFCC